MSLQTWKVYGFDAFEGGPDAWYELGSYSTYEKALDHAKKKRDELEKTQPSASSGGSGFGGIQDRVYVIHPNGRREQVR